MADEATNPRPFEIAAPRRGIRWWGAGLGVIFALADTLSLKWLGIALQSNGHDVTLTVAAWFGISFSIVGYLLSATIEDRAVERAAMALIKLQMRELEESRKRIIQAEKLAALGQLASAIAHEVRNPLAVIRSAAQSVSENLRSNDDTLQRSCRFVIEETDRLANLVNSLLAFARPVKIERRRAAVDDLFDRALAITREELSDKPIDLRRNTPAEAPAARADPDLIGQVLAGLISNAAHAMPEGGKILLECRAENALVALSVADTGPGVPPELRARIFEPFFTTRAKGVGLGLAIARQIVEAHGGSIEVGSNPAGGARFTLKLPRAYDAEPNR